MDAENISDSNLTSTTEKWGSNRADPYPYVVTYQTVVYTILFLVGVIGNLLVMVVIARKKGMRNSTNVLLFNLALADFLLLLTFVPFNLVEIYGYERDWTYSFIIHCMAARLIRETCADVSSVIIVAITIDRFYAIWFPLSASLHLTTKRGILVGIVVWILTTLANAPRLFMFEVVAKQDSTFACSLVMSFAELNNTLMNFRIIAFYFVPLFAVIILYGLIIWKLMKTPPILLSAATESSKNNERKQVVYMVGVVVALYFLLLFPLRLLVVLEAFGFGLQKKMEPEILINVIIALRVTLCVNSTINPILYNFMSKRFRNAFKSILRLDRCCSKRDGNYSKDMSSASVRTIVASV